MILACPPAKERVNRFARAVPGAMNDLRQLIREIHRRSLWQVLGVYLVSGWVAYQVVESLTDGLGLPTWLPAAAVALLVAGLPVVLATAFIQEGPSDRKVEAEDEGLGLDDGGARAAGPAGRRILTWRTTLIAGTIAAALWGLVAGGWLIFGPGPAGPGSDHTAADDTGPPGDVGLDPTRVAVLYLDDLSPNGELGYLADGFTEALIHELSQVDRLEVVSRNGVKPYRDGDATIDSIARALSAGTLVEGSLEQSGDRLRVTVQLVDGVTGAHVLSRQVEREGADLLSLRDEIVREVADLMRQRLGETIRLRERRAAAENDEAWELVQRAERMLDDATELLSAGETAAADRTLVRADSILADAARRAPGWTRPLVLRGAVAVRGGEWTYRDGAEATRAAADTHYVGAIAQLDRALTLDPGDASARAARGEALLYQSWEGDKAKADSLAEEAERELRRAVDIDPGNAAAWSTLSSLLQFKGRFVESRQAAERAYDADPFLLDARAVLARLCATSLELGDFGAARQRCSEGRRRFPAEDRFVHAFFFILAGDQAEPLPDSAWRLVEAHVELVPAPERALERDRDELLVAAALAGWGMTDSAMAVVERVQAKRAGSASVGYPMAIARLRLGQRDSAITNLRRLVAAYPTLRSYLARDSAFRELRDDPRFQALVDSL
jgi:TolB-like protein